ncbi:hypothetical protein OTU49_005683, partial [Cherax quadricarinatus]
MDYFFVVLTTCVCSSHLPPSVLYVPSPLPPFPFTLFTFIPITSLVIPYHSSLPFLPTLCSLFSYPSYPSCPLPLTSPFFPSSLSPFSTPFLSFPCCSLPPPSHHSLFAFLSPASPLCLSFLSYFLPPPPPPSSSHSLS